MNASSDTPLLVSTEPTLSSSQGGNMPDADVEEAREMEEEKEDVNVRSRSRDERKRDTSYLYKGLTPEQLEHIETRPLRHNYVICRPRALQYSYRSKVISSGTEGASTPGLLTREQTPMGNAAQFSVAPRAPRTREDVEKHRERLDLFIDLIWVGIIANLSEAFAYFYYEAGNNAGEATLLFILLFLPSWRIWNFLREFLNSFYQDDMLQRYFIFWILVLSLFYGNNLAYFPGDIEGVKVILVTLYLCIRGSFVFMELFYSFWIPWLRRLMFFNFLVALPSSGMWIAVIFVPGVNAVGPAVAAVIWEYFVPLIFDSPLRDRLMPSEYRKEVDAHHLTARMGNFLIITIGEGVLLLIKGGPLGIGITGTAATSVWSLSLYMLLTFLYFNRDQSETYLPAVKLGGWRSLLWTSFHIPLFASLLTLSAGLMFLITGEAEKPEKAKSFDIPEEEMANFIHRSIWLVSISLTVAVSSMTFQALLDKPLDPPGTLMLNNRYARLSGRAVYITIIMCVPLTGRLNKTLFLGIISILLTFVMHWEWVVCLEKGGGFFEPKGLTVLMKKELKETRSQSVE